VDTGDLQDVLINLALNARDAMPDGGFLIIETGNKHLDEEYFKRNPPGKSGDYVMLSVSDSGKGIPSEFKDRVLEPFFTTKESGKGTGLGLSMVYGFVQRSNGHLKIYSEPGDGTTIKVYLPRARMQKQSAKTIAEEELVLPGGHETILIVDDEKGLRDIAAIHLQELGYQTYVAVNAQQALDVMQSGVEIDLLFSDIVMPGGVDGYDLASQVSEKYPRCRILLTSGFTNKREEYVSGENSSLAHIASNLISKPYNKRDLALGIRQVLDMDI